MYGINLYWFLTLKKIIVIKYLIIESPKPGKYELDATRIAQHTASQRTSDTAAQQHCQLFWTFKFSFPYVILNIHTYPFMYYSDVIVL